MRPCVVAATALSLVVLAGCTDQGSEEVSADGGSTSYVELPDPAGEDVTAVDPGVNGFVDAGEDPRSTFGLDVDTGSLRLARALLEGGARVPDEAVRPEEWVNAFSYDDAPPTDDDLALTTEAGPAPTLDGATVVRVAVAAREIDPEDRPRVNVTLVVDRSGSMAEPDKLDRVQQSLTLLATHLDADDTVSVVSFEDEAVPLLPPTPISERAAVLDTVAELTAGGSTNLGAGLRAGYAQADEAYDPDAVNVVVLCSDGIANVGLTEPEAIVKRIVDEAERGVHLVTVGFGLGGYNDHLMEQLADQGDGFYSYVDTAAEAERLFVDQLTTTLVPVAEEARAQVAFDPGMVTSYRLIGYENRAMDDEDFDDLETDAGELGAGHHATALYEVELAEGVEPGDVLGTARLRWVSPDGGAGDALADVLAPEPTAGLSPALALATTVADLAQVLRRDPAYAERGVTLRSLADRAAALQEQEVAGADDLAELIAMARPGR